MDGGDARDEPLTYLALGAALCGVSPEREQAALRAAFYALSDPLPDARDAMGAPVEQWDELRQGVKAIIRTIGLEAAARQYGASPSTLQRLVKTTSQSRRTPGNGARARLARMLDRTGGKTHLSNPAR